MKLAAILVTIAWTAVSAAPPRLAVVNHSPYQVPATVVTVDAAGLYSDLGLAAGTPLHAWRHPGGSPVPVQPGTRNGRSVLRFYLSLRPAERVELDLRRAASWPTASSLATVAWDRGRHTGSIGNGVVAMRVRDNQWDLLFDGPGSAAIAAEKDRVLLVGGGYYGWVDNQRRGRISDTRAFDPAKDGSRNPGPEGAGMISTRDASILSSDAGVTDKGDVVLRIVKSFQGFARGITWTETYTLPAGLPLLKYETHFENAGDDPGWVSYVGRGGWMYARYGPGLLREPRLISDAKGTEKILGADSVRIAWVPDHAWSGLESDSGMNVAISTLRNIPSRLMQGSMVWQFAANSFQLPLVEHSQGQYPWIVKKGEPAESGIAFLASAGGLPVAQDGRALLLALDGGTDVEPSTPYSVLLGGQVLQAATVSAGGAVLQQDSLPGALAADFSKAYDLHVSSSSPVQLSAELLDGSGTVRLGRIVGTRTIDMNSATGWTGPRRFVLKADKAGIIRAALRRHPFASPEILSPAGGASITDIAAYFKWKPVADGRSYELQLSQDAAFQNALTAEVKGETHYLPEQLPAPGRWYWRLRAKSPAAVGEWSAVREFTVNAQHGKAPILRPVSTDRPLFTIEAGDRSDFRKLAKAIPADLRENFAVVIGDKVDLPRILEPARELGIQVMLRTHHPSPVDGWTPLAEVENVFQQFPNVIGIQGGEALGSWYGGKDPAQYIQRLVALAIKYGRIVHEGDGCYDENKWKELYDDPAAGAMVRTNPSSIVFSQKNNIFNKQLMTQSAVLGQYLAGTIGNSGAWEDGGWYWAQVGFRKLGESFGARSGRLHDMPPIFWDLTFLMGLARGATVFSMDGQGGVFMRGLYDASRPEHRTQVLWSGEGQQTEAFQRYVLPFLRAVVRHRLIPSREDVLADIRIAVTLDGAEQVTNVRDDRYREFWALYAGTYGFRAHGAARGEVIEYFPNTGRYRFIPILPPGANLGPNIRHVPIRELQDPQAVRALFDRAYPQWYEGSALVMRAGDLVAILNSHENEDVPDTYAIPVNRGILRAISGTASVHSYVMGKFEEGGRRLWLQANVNYPDRPTRISFTCDREPQWNVEPRAAVKISRWDASAHQLHLELAHDAGAVEISLEIAK